MLEGSLSGFRRSQRSELDLNEFSLNQNLLSVEIRFHNRFVSLYVDLFHHHRGLSILQLHFPNEDIISEALKFISIIMLDQKFASISSIFAIGS